MVDLGGYVIILVETREKKVKLYGKERGGDGWGVPTGNMAALFYKSNARCIWKVSRE